jgi:hypothetical protein
VAQSWPSCRHDALTGLGGECAFAEMELKPTIERFMGNLFRERTEALKMVLEVRRDYRQRYFHRDCVWDSRGGVVARSDREKIVVFTPSEIGAFVVMFRNGVLRSRYRLKTSSESWLIWNVDIECLVCHRQGSKADCRWCA